MSMVFLVCHRNAADPAGSVPARTAGVEETMGHFHRLLLGLPRRAVPGLFQRYRRINLSPDVALLPRRLRVTAPTSTRKPSP